MRAVGSAGMVVSGVVVSSVHVDLAGVGSVLLAGSVARTWKVSLPSPRPSDLCGLAQAAKALASSWQAKLLPAFVDVKMKIGLLELLRAGGAAVMVVSGTVVSTVQV